MIWVGNNYNGDLAYWYDSPIYSYLEAGGNVLLLGRYGQSFVTPVLQEYLGLTWAESATSTLGNCVASGAGLTTMSLIGTQSWCAVYENTFTQPESQLLFEETASFTVDRGLGVWRRPPGGGLHRTNGGNFAFISGRPYRYNHFDLRGNIETLLLDYFEQPKVPVAVPEETPVATFHLRQNYPNPFNPRTTIAFTLPAKSLVSLRVYDAAGRLVRTLAKGEFTAGPHAIEWNGTSNAGTKAASGVYFYRLQAGELTSTRKMVLLK